MKRVAIGVVAAVLYLSTVFAGVAGGHTFAVDTHLSIHKAPIGATAPGAKVVVHGKLVSSRAVCESDQVVKLLRVRSGPDKVIHKDRTDRQGEYSFVRHPHHDMKVYTKFPGSFESSYGHSHRCRASRSTNLFINVKG